MDYWKSDDWSMSSEPTPSSGGGGVLVIVHHDALPAGQALLATAQTLASDLSASVRAVLLNGDEAAGNELVQAGASQVWLLKADKFSAAASLAKLVGELSPEVILLASDERSNALAGELAGRLNAGLVVGCSNVTVDYSERSLQATQPVYSGAGVATWTLSGKPQIVTVRPGLASPLINKHNTGQVEQYATTTSHSPLKEVSRTPAPKPEQNLLQAKVIVAGGRGLDAAAVEVLKELAATLGATVGATKSAVQAGWATPAQQIGMLGQSVRPDLYFAVGISGTPEHLVGIREGATIVAINPNPTAPIFKLADYGIVGEASAVLPALTARLKKIYG